MNTEISIFDNLNLLRIQMPVPFFIKLFLFITLFSFKLYAQEYSKIELEKKVYADSVLRAGIQSKNELQIAEAYYLLGKVEAAAGNYLRSHALFLKSLHIQEKYGDSFKLGRLYMVLCEKEHTQKRYDVGLRHLKKARSIFERIKSDSGMARIYGFLIQYYFVTPEGHNNISVIKPNKDSAQHYYNLSKAIFKRMKDTLGMAELNQKFGALYGLRKDPVALVYLEDALTNLRKMRKKTSIMGALLNLASIQLQLNKPKEAFKNITEARKIYDQYSRNHFYHDLIFEQVYVRYYEAIGDWKKVGIHLKTAHVLEKKILAADTEGAISRLHIEFETGKKEALLKEQKNKLDLQEENARIQRQFLITLALLLVVTIALSFVFFRLYRKNQRISKRNEVLVNEQNHRVKNNLQVVSSLLHLQSKRLNDVIARQAVEESMLRIETMAILHRKLYDQDELAMVNLADYIMDLVDEVLKTFDYAHIDPVFELAKVKLSADQAMAVGLIITELVTNACKYAFPHTKGPTLVISSFFEKENLNLIVKDNGPGFVPKLSTAKDRTFGMWLIQIQITQLFGSYAFESKDGSTFTMKFKPQVP